MPISLAPDAQARVLKIERDAIRPLQPVPLTVLNFFPAFQPPKSGGEMRYWHLYSRLATQGFNIQLISPTFPFTKAEEIDHTPLLHETRVPKTMAHHRLHQVMGRLLGRAECSGPVVSLATPFHKAFLARVRESVARSRIVIFDYPFPLSVLPPRGDCDPLVVYNAHNVEGLLLRQILPNPIGRLVAARMASLEKKICRRADVVFACSHDDADRLARNYDLDPSKIYMVPNGTEVASVNFLESPDSPAGQEARKRLGLHPAALVALFMGSHHPPNREAIEFLIREVAPDLPRVSFLIAGSVCKGISGDVPANVRLHGPFEENEKETLLQSATVAVNPLFSGSGTNLKMLEWFAYGLPVVSTSVGARGLALRDGVDFRLAEPADFAPILDRTIADEPLRRNLRQSARQLAETKYDWDRIARSAADILHHKTHRRVLVLNNYPVTPTTFGGKVRMARIYGHLAREFNVTILTSTPDKTYRRRIVSRGLEEINVPESGWVRLAKRVAYALIGAAADDLVAYLSVGLSRNMKEAARRERHFAGLIALSQPYMVPLVRGESRPVIYESHDVAVHLKKQIYDDNFWSGIALKLVRKCENEAIAKAQVVASCSEENRQWFLDAYPKAANLASKIIIVPNGVDASSFREYRPENRQALQWKAGFRNQPVAIFLGSGHPPNVEAVQFILKNLVPHHPKVLFLILGSVCWPFQYGVLADNLLLFYEQSESVKNRLLELSDIALNPLSAGSGTSLKVFEYMAAGCAVVTTEIGARGSGIESGVHGIVCPLDEFADAIDQLVADPEKCRQIGQMGQTVARQSFDWRATARPLVNAVREHTKPRDSMGDPASPRPPAPPASR